MRERGDGSCFGFETRERVRPRGDVGRQDFDGDVAAQLVVAGPIHLSHAAAADESDDFVRAESRARSERHEEWGDAIIRDLPSSAAL